MGHISCVIIKKTFIFGPLINNTSLMFTFDQFLGFLAIMIVLTIGFWLMIFLVSILPYWIFGSLNEKFRERKAEKLEKK